MCVFPDLTITKPALSEKVELARSRGFNPVLIEERTTHFLKTNLLATSKGKTLYQIFKEFSKAVAAYLSRALITDVNNIALVLAVLSPKDPDVAYIKKYAEKRLGSTP